MKYKTKYSVLNCGVETFTSDNELIAHAYASTYNSFERKNIKIVKHNKRSL